MSNLRMSIQVPQKTIESEELDNIKTLTTPYEICDYLERKGIILSHSCIKALERAIISTGDLLHLYEFYFLAVNNGINIHRKTFEDIIAFTKNAKLMYYCLIFVPDTDRKMMIEELLKTGNAMYIEALDSDEAKSVIGDIRKYNNEYDTILNQAKQGDYFPKSLSRFKDAKNNIDEIKRRVIASRNPYNITELANYIEYLNKYKKGEYSLNDLEAAQLGLEDPMNLYEYISSVRSVQNKKPFIQAVAKQNQIGKKYLEYIRDYVEGLTEDERDFLDELLERQQKIQE